MKILELPPDYAVFTSINLDEVNTDLEICTIKSTWDRQNEQIAELCAFRV